MLEFIIKITLLGSIFGLVFIIIRKIPVLKSLPEEEMRISQPKGNFLGVIRIFETFLRRDLKEKILDFIKSFTVESLKKAKKEGFEEKEEVDFSEDYWEKIRRG